MLQFSYERAVCLCICVILQQLSGSLCNVLLIQSAAIPWTVGSIVQFLETFCEFADQVVFITASTFVNLADVLKLVNCLAFINPFVTSYLYSLFCYELL